jgi:hypothetical protein
MSSRSWLFVWAVAAICSALQARAATITSTWLGGAGAWEDPTQWSAGVPQNTASDSYTAAIDGQNPLASQVALSTAAAIDSLQVDADDQLQISPTGALTVGTSVQNAGVISLQAGSSLQLGASATTFLGGGTVQLQGGSLLLTNTSPLTIDNTIEGPGQISGPVTNAEVVNRGAIIAGPSGGIFFSHIVFPQGGVFKATDSGFGFENYFLSGATIQLVRSGIGSNDIGGIDNSTLSAVDHSGGQLDGGFDSDRFMTDSTSTISLADGSLSNSELDGNFGTISVDVSGTILLHGTISLGQFYPVGPTTIENYGKIWANVLERSSAPPVTLTGGGQFTFDDAETGSSGELSNVDNDLQARGRVALVNNGGTVEAIPGTKVEGDGSVVQGLILNAGLTQNGLVKAPVGSQIDVVGATTGHGRWIADGGLIHITSDVETTGDVQVFHSGTLSVDGIMSAGNLVVDNTGSLDVNGLLKVAGNLAFDGANGGRWLFAPGASVTLTRGGGAAIGDWGGWQRIEAAGLDLGLVAAGFTNGNFYLPELVIGPDGRLALRDQFDNGNRAPNTPEAVYVDTLVFSDALGLLDLNGLHLYYNHLVGSGAQIIDVAVPEPAELGLFAVLVLPLALRCRAWSARRCVAIVSGRSC